MEREKDSSLQEGQLEGVTGGERRVSDTQYTHRGCGGKIRTVDDFDSGFWASLFGSSHVIYYECATCGQRWLANSDVPGKYFDA